MVKTLQKKFIVTAMIAITILLAVLLGAINLANALAQSHQSDRLLQSLAMQEGFGPAPRFDEEGVPGARRANRGGFLMEPLTEDSRMAALTFSVRTDGEGNVVNTDLRRIASVDAETAEALARQALTEGKGYGRLENYKYQIVEPSDTMRTVVFLDVSSQRSSVLRIAALSALAGILAWGTMLALVWGLSRRAIRPIAENMQRQRQFVTDAGHELKTPLAIIQANVEAMELMGGESKYSRNIRGQVRRLSGLTQNLLTLARMDESTTPPALTDTDLSTLASESLEMFREGAALKSIRVESQIQDGIRVQGDRQQLQQLLSILLDNAVKYCPEGGRLSLHLGREDRAVLRLRNSIGPEGVDTERIFDRFYRADSARTQQSGGYGIGLSAAQAIVRLHKGDLSAAREDGEIVFTLKL